MRRRITIPSAIVVSLLFCISGFGQQKPKDVPAPARGAKKPAFVAISNASTSDKVAKFVDTAGTVGETTNIFETAGRLGIGTSTPQAGLHIFSTASGPGGEAFAGMGPDLSSAGTAFNFGYSASTFGVGGGFFNVRPSSAAAGAVSPNPSLRFMTKNLQRMMIADNGVVGIGKKFAPPSMGGTNVIPGAGLPNVATVVLDIDGDINLRGGGILTFSDGSSMSTAGISTVAPGAGIAITGSATAVIVGLADNGVTAAKINTAEVQKRVSGTCAAPSSIIAVNGDGTVTCGVPGETRIFSMSTSMVIPVGVTQLIVEAWGGGGGGSAEEFGFTNGGGGGAYARAMLPATPGQSVSIVIGGGGLGGFYTGPTLTPGQSGTSTTISLGATTLFTAGGGGGGSAAGGGPGGVVNAPTGTTFLQQAAGQTGGQSVAFGSGPGGSSGLPGSTPGRGGDGAINPGGAGGNAPGFPGSPGLMIITFAP